MREIRTVSWWHERILGAYMSYWIYQHLGNLSPAELAENALLAAVRDAQDAEEILRAFAKRAEEEIAATRWSYHRDFGRTRLLVLDSRAGRVLDEDRREMLSEPVPERPLCIPQRARRSTGSLGCLSSTGPVTRSVLPVEYTKRPAWAERLVLTRGENTRAAHCPACAGLGSAATSREPTS